MISRTYTRRNQGTCSTATTVTLNGDIIEDIAVEDGCDGNLQGLCNLMRGRAAQTCIEALEAVRCEDKATSCPHQIALCLREALAAQQAG